MKEEMVNLLLMTVKPMICGWPCCSLRVCEDEVEKLEREENCCGKKVEWGKKLKEEKRGGEGGSYSPLGGPLAPQLEREPVC